MPIFGATFRASLVRITCPACHEVQARARAASGHVYQCRRCFAPMRVSERDAPATESHDARARRDRVMRQMR